MKVNEEEKKMWTNRRSSEGESDALVAQSTLTWINSILLTAISEPDQAAGARVGDTFAGHF
jgi:hypothetical protein